MKKIFSYMMLNMIILTSMSYGVNIESWKTHYPSTNSAWIEVQDKPNNTEDWVGIYPANSSSDWANVVEWSWARDTTTANDPGDWYEFELADGEYEARFYLNNTFKVEDSVYFSVGKSHDISVAKEVYSANETVSVTVSKLSGDQDWVGIYPKNADNSWGNVIAWNWITGKGTFNLSTKKKEMPAGEYEARLFFHNSYALEGKVAFSVISGADKYPKTTTFTKRLTDNAVSRPSVGNPSVDTVFGTKIKMLNKPDGKASPYPKIQAWNSDMTLLRIDNRLYDANTLEESAITRGLSRGEGYRKLCSRLSSSIRWSTKDPKKFYVVNSHLKLVEGRIVGNDINCNTVLFDFKAHNFEQANIGPGEGNIDFNDKYVVFPVKKKGDSKIYVLLYDLENKRPVWNEAKLYNAKDAHWEKSGNYWAPTVLDWVTVSPSGKYIVINDQKTGMYRYDINFENKRRLEYRDSRGNKQSQGGHGDIGFDTNGNEVFVQFIAGAGIYSFNLNNPNEEGKVLLDSPYGGGFVSCRNTVHKGWCYVTTRVEGFREVFALKLDGTSNKTVQRFSQTHDNYYGGTVSPDGTKVLFSNYWNSNTLNTFIAEVK